MAGLSFDDSAPSYQRIRSQRRVGFSGVVRKLKARGYSEEQARRITAHAARSASAAAKRQNPRLRRVPGA